jgi:molybdate transport system substrate-binding protein
MKNNLIVCCLVILSLISGTSALAGELIVSAAASLTNAFGAVKPAFEKANPGTTLTFNFGASGTLLNQIAQGAPVDVFVSADMKSMDDAVAKNIVDAATRATFARNELVLAVPRTAGKTLTLTDLKKPEVARIGIGNAETVPAGRYARLVLEKENLWQELQAKLIMAESVRQVLDYLQRGEVDAGFVYATDATQAKEKVAVSAVIPMEKPVLYPVAATAGAKNKEGAAQFINFLRSAEGQAILAAYGFEKP